MLVQRRALIRGQDSGAPRPALPVTCCQRRSPGRAACSASATAAETTARPVPRAAGGRSERYRTKPFSRQEGASFVKPSFSNPPAQGSQTPPSLPAARRYHGDRKPLAAPSGSEPLPHLRLSQLFLPRRPIFPRARGLPGFPRTGIIIPVGNRGKRRPREGEGLPAAGQWPA